MMKGHAISYAGASMILLLAGCRTGPAQFGGTWTLNVEKSNWGQVTRPKSVVVNIDHRDPALSYSGLVTYAGAEVRPFAFEGAIDGREYPVSRSCGQGFMAVQRVDSFTLSSVFRSADGRCSETVRTTISRNGSRLTRQLHSKSPSGEQSWTEVYDRRPAA